MKAVFEYHHRHCEADLLHPIDISLPLSAGDRTVNCFYAPLMEITPVIDGNFIGDTRRGGSVNFMNVHFNPHGNGTHTECVGHIAKKAYTIHEQLRNFFYLAKLVSLYPVRMDDGDRVITRETLQSCLVPGEAQALILRTLPNDPSKRYRHYSGTNPPYLAADAARYLIACGIDHLLIDLPSVDKESDGGALAAHKAFWQYPEDIREGCTITELIFAPDEIIDGFFLLNIQIASFDLDASPSKPVLYRLTMDSH